MVKTTAVLITHASTASRDDHSQESTLLTKAINCIGGAAGRSAITSLRSAVHGSASVNLSLQTTHAQAPAPRSVVYSGAHQPLALAQLRRRPSMTTSETTSKHSNNQPKQKPGFAKNRFELEPQKSTIIQTQPYPAKYRTEPETKCHGSYSVLSLNEIV